MSKLSSIIAEKRVKKGYTQDVLAKLAGISAPQLSNIEQGKNKPTSTTLYKLSQALECDFEELFDLLEQGD